MTRTTWVYNAHAALCNYALLGDVISSKQQC